MSSPGPAPEAPGRAVWSVLAGEGPGETVDEGGRGRCPLIGGETRPRAVEHPACTIAGHHDGVTHGVHLNVLGAARAGDSHHEAFGTLHLVGAIGVIRTGAPDSMMRDAVTVSMRWRVRPSRSAMFHASESEIMSVMSRSLVTASLVVMCMMCPLSGLWWRDRPSPN